MPYRSVSPRLARLSLAVASGMLIAAGPSNGTLLVQVVNVRNSSGLVHVDVCPRARFLKEDCPFSGEARARARVTEVVVHGVPAGRFAVQATHDENANHKVDRGLFGIPKEGIGFSRDARIVLGPPKWEDAVMTFDGRSGRAALRLRYFLGSPGPSPR